jgi:hypothetical protein
VLGATAILMLAGCGGGGSTPPSGGAPVATSMPSCAGAGAEVELPSGWPKTFPLQPGTVVTSARREAAGAVIDAVVPDNLKSAKQFISRELPNAGYTLSGGEAEANEAETDFTGHGVVGRLKVRMIERCPGAVTLTVGYVEAS